MVSFFAFYVLTLYNIFNPPIAQLAEQLPLKQTVPGSSPGGRTKCRKKYRKK
jgi:hypothetical protein